MNTMSSEQPETNKHGVCPWWMAYAFDNLLRRLMHPPARILGPYVQEGMTALDLGCGFGHYSLGMARLTGKTGKVVAVDVQQKMLDKTMGRARGAGLADIIQPLLCDGHKIGLPLRLDFALASNSLHETPDPRRLLSELFGMLSPGGLFLLMEPGVHLRQEEFEAEVAMAGAAGFIEVDRPRVIRQRCSLLKKTAP